MLHGGPTLLLHDLYALEIRWNLVFVIILLSLGFFLSFHSTNLTIYYDDVYYGFGFLSDGFMILDIDYGCCNVPSFFSLFISSNISSVDINIWHARRHIGQDRINHLARDGLLGQLANIINLPMCEHCLVGNSTRKPFDKRTRDKFPIQLVHSDICGPINMRARRGTLYFTTFSDDYLWYDVVYLITLNPKY